MQVGILEDEYPAVRLLSGLIGKLRPGWEVVVLPETVKEAVDWFATHAHPELLFLDVNLADGNSFKVLEEARPQSAVIFTTAYDKYAIQAFSVDSIDYLLKPITEERLEQAILKYEKRVRGNAAGVPGSDWEKLRETLDSIAGRTKRYRTRFLISVNHRHSALEVKDVSYFYFEDRVAYAVTHNGERFMVDVSLNQLEKELEPDLFYRVNRQFILSVGCIRKIEPYFNNRYVVHIEPDCDIPIVVSREKISSLKSWLSY